MIFKKLFTQMPIIRNVPVQDLILDLENFRTVIQPDQTQALHAMVTISPDYFWALTDSLIDSGYLPTENILVLEDGVDPTRLVVKEGNRRIAALQMIFGHLSPAGLAMPATTSTRITSLDAAWKAANSQVPCAVYSSAEAATVDRIVTLAHGKGEKAGRDAWNAVARARHNRARGGTETALDLLEKYLKHGTNLNTQQTERWSGAYPLTVLDEAIKKLAPYFGASNAPDLLKDYPASIQQRTELEQVLWGIGQEMIRFPHLRRGLPKLVTDYKLNAAAAGSGTGISTTGTGAASAGSGGISAGSGTAGGTNAGSATSGTGGTTPGAGGTTPGTGGTTPGAGGTTPGTGVSSQSTASKKATSTTDPRTVMTLLRKLKVGGANRQKVEALRKEALELDIAKTPIAFCFLLRSMFEISAKAYCDDHQTSGGPSPLQNNGKDKRLGELLKEIAKYMTAGAGDPKLIKSLHGAQTEISKTVGLLSVTSMNHLVHSPTFSVTAGDISVVFGNIFPMLEELNR